MTQPAKVKPAPRKRAPAKQPRPKAATAPAPPSAAKERQHPHLRALAAFAILLAAAVAASVAFLGEDAPAPTPARAAAVSPAELAARAEELGRPIYWAGSLPGRTLELTSSETGAFVRYLPGGTPVGGADPTLTIATYPMAEAYATAVRRARAAGMTSRRTRDGGVAVWSTAQPTSVYLAWPGVRSLVEVYAPRAADARATALAAVRPVR